MYASTLRALRAEFGDATDTAALEPRQVAAWFTRQWGQAAPATWNRNLDAIRSAQRYWQDQQWMNATDLTSALRRRQRAADRSRALSRADVERLLTREDISIRERTLWRLLYETAARSAEVLRLDVEDLDLPNRKAKVRRKGGADRRHRLADRHRPPAAAAAEGPQDRPGVPDRPPGPRPAAAVRHRPGERPGAAVLPAGRGPVQGRVRRRDPAPAAAQRADPRRRSRRVDSDADGQERPHVGRLAGQVRAAVRRGPGPLAGAQRPGPAALIRLTRSMASGSAAQFAIVAGVRDHLTPGMRAEIAESVCIPRWNSLRAGRWRQAHDLARVEEAFATDDVAIATAKVNGWLALDQGHDPSAIRAEVQGWDVATLPATFQVARHLLLRQDGDALPVLGQLVSDAPCR